MTEYIKKERQDVSLRQWTLSTVICYCVICFIFLYIFFVLSHMYYFLDMTQTRLRLHVTCPSWMFLTLILAVLSSSLLGMTTYLSTELVVQLIKFRFQYVYLFTFPSLHLHVSGFVASRSSRNVLAYNCGRAEVPSCVLCSSSVEIYCLRTSNTSKAFWQYYVVKMYLSSRTAS